MVRPAFRTVTRTQGNNRALKEGVVKPRNFNFDFEEVPVLVKGFRRMVRELAYDISEMALTTYVCARAHGVKFTALPIFLVRDFHHGAILQNLQAGIASPKGLEGRRVGVNRGYTVTTGVWARSILQDEHGVDLSKVTWVRSGDEHVADYRPPANVVPLEEGHELEADLASGALVAAVGAKVEHPDVRSMIDDPFAAAVAAMKDRGLYPINHLVVVRDAVLEENPDLAVQVFEAFAASKKLYVDDLKAGRIAAPTPIDRVHLAALEVMDDPLPYGIAPNRKVLEMLMAHAVTQKIVPAAMDIDGLFAASTRDLVA
jgi:4,5-dihydroxyphthalate decarboxylase